METKTVMSKHIDFEEFIEATTGAVLRALAAHGVSSELNPQPLPPHEGASLSPQPLPPHAEAALSPQPLPPHAEAALSPQPLPPRAEMRLASQSQRHGPIIVGLIFNPAAVAE